MRDFMMEDFTRDIFTPAARLIEKTISKKMAERRRKGTTQKYSKWRNYAQKGLGYAGKGIKYLMQDHSNDDGINWLGLAEKGVGLAAAFL